MTARAAPAADATPTPIEGAHESFLVHKEYRYLKVALLLSLASIVAYFAYDPLAGHNGGTWLGYTLGTIGAVLILWLMWFGIKKRRYGPGNWSLKAWLSAHVYLGLSLIIIATLHAGFQFGWNIHTFAYVLMMIVIISGIVGIMGYARLPRLMTLNRMSQTLSGMALETAELDRQAADLAIGLGDDFAEEVRRSREETRLGGGLWRKLSARDVNSGNAIALQRVQAMAQELPADSRERAAGLIVALRRKEDVLARARRDIRFKTLMDLWLQVHVPVSFALLAGLTAHIISVFYYWG